jgi:hypothetical protein
MQTIKAVGAAIILIASLVGCGGGGGDSSPSSQTSAEGFWEGTTANSTITGVVLDDGTYYVIYSPVGSGYIQGSSTSNNGSFTSNNARDFNFRVSRVYSATIDASYTEKQSFAGRISYSAENRPSFSASYNSRYEDAPSLTALAGTFAGSAVSLLGSENIALTITSDGAVSGIGAISRCSATGTVSPHSSGNIYDLSLTSGGAPCPRPGETVTGILYYNSSNKTVIAAAQNSTRTEGFLFAGVKP